MCDVSCRADVVIGTDETPDYVEEVRRITGGEGAWGGLDPIAGENTGKMLSSVRPKGTVYVYGNVSFLIFLSILPMKLSITHELLRNILSYFWPLNCFWAQKTVDNFQPSSQWHLHYA